MSERAIVIGVDVGTTSTKAAAFDLDGVMIGEANVPTRWSVATGGETDMDVEELTADFVGLVAGLAEATPGRVVGIGITGMAETGVIVNESGEPRHRAFAWFDQRGAAELDALPNDMKAQFPGATGLALKAECSLSKVLWLCGNGFEVHSGDVWLNAQEFIAFRLTGIKATEPSLASRTAFWDQDGAPWSPALDVMGVGADFIPAFVPAGTASGVVGDTFPESIRGAAVTVTGHDHIVGAVGSGAFDSNQLFNSCGTADVLVRSIPWELTPDDRARLVAGGLSAGRHVLPGRAAVLGATRFGLVLERVLAMLGVDDRGRRAELVDAWGRGADASGAVTVSEPGGWINEVTISLFDACGPQQVVSAAIDYGLDSMRAPVATLEEVTGASDNILAGGGWAQLDGVVRAKSSLLPTVTRSTIAQPGVRAAAAFAGIAAGHLNQELTRNIAGRTQPTTQREKTQ